MLEVPVIRESDQAPGRRRVLAVARSPLVRRALAGELGAAFELRFAEQPADAATLLGGTAFDAVVVDRGAGPAPPSRDFLAEVSRRQPAASRVLLCHFLAPFARVGVAHAALVRPWEAGDLARTVERLLERGRPRSRGLEPSAGLRALPRRPPEEPLAR